MTDLTLRDLGRRFGSFEAVRDVNLELKSGEFVSLLGPSGCGKTTTLRMIAGFIEPTAGTIELGGKVIASPSASLPPEKRGMSMIFQSYAIWPNMTVFENVAFGLKLRKLGRDEVRKRVGEILEIVQLGELADRYPAELSGGQQQRVALARAVVIRPAVLLLDEPLSNLDANLREEMRFEIRRMHDELKITTVYVTHDQSEAMVTSDRIAVMNRGRIEQIDRPVDLYMRPRTRFVASFIGRTNFLEAKRDGDRLVFDGFSVPLAAVPGPLPNGGAVTVSVRPHALDLSAQRPAGGDRIVLEGRIARRAFLGDSWNYVFAPAGGAAALTVTAAPNKVLDDSAAAWLTIDPTQLVPIA